MIGRTVVVQHHSSRMQLGWGWRGHPCMKEGRPLGWRNEFQPSHYKVASIMWLRGDKWHVPEGELTLPRANISTHPPSAWDGGDLWILETCKLRGAVRDVGAPKATSSCLSHGGRANGRASGWEDQTNKLKTHTLSPVRLLFPGRNFIATEMLQALWSLCQLESSLCTCLFVYTNPFSNRANHCALINLPGPRYKLPQC